MESKLSDKDIHNLFTDLKKTEKEYPPDMIQSRRDTYIKQVAMVVITKAGEGEEVTIDKNSAN